MSGVDVLAVMDRAFCYAQNNCIYDDVRELDVARAAVAELIEACYSLSSDPHAEDWARLYSALSRVRGAE